MNACQYFNGKGAITPAQYHALPTGVDGGTRLLVSARRIHTAICPGASQFMIRPSSGDAEIFVEHDNQVPGSWYVRLVNRHTRQSGLGPIYIPPVTTQEGLEKALKRVWEIDQQHRQFTGRFFTRLRDTTPPPPNDADSTTDATSSLQLRNA